MADEARAMLDALMGADRNASIPAVEQQQQQQQHGRRKRSCYDPAVCPLYCAWGTDLHELFTNTKSDIGPNPRVCDDDAREEYLGLPGHEQDRLGFDAMLFERLRDLVRGCDRIVNRNKDKLRQEVARQQRARQGSANGGNTNTDDPAANISEDKVRKVAEDRARLELLEEDVGRMVAELEGLDEEESGLVEGLADEDTGGANEEGEKAAEVDNAQENEEEKAKNGAPTEKAKEEVKEGDEASNSTKEAKEAEGEDAKSASEPPMPDDESKTSKQLAEIRAKKRSILAALSSRIEQAAPLREAIAGDTRYLHHFRSNHTIDKCVCDVSGNFMSFRDADERIAAHYAGKQYVGWKMVRDKLDELKKKYGNGGPPPPPRGPPPGYGPPSRGGEGGGGGYRRGGGGGGGDGRRRDRSRSRERHRDRDRDRDRHRGGRRRSPDRWDRDRAPRDGDRSSRGGGGGRRDRRY